MKASKVIYYIEKLNSKDYKEGTEADNIWTSNYWVGPGWGKSHFLADDHSSDEDLDEDSDEASDEDSDEDLDEDED